ncbi:Abi family protein [Lactobacillus apis]|uniref:Abi-like family protein n=1 Tax=Lactobacillus apis TaxID=303541 RepID=A0A0F4LPF2_9LACO|nr:Abi family protein [Lactobacillus apis]KJY60193.1 Abi-like family protein [Lactobacillus apis]
MTQKREFKTIREQIEILEGRGLIIDDKEKAEQYLLTNNYYNIINGYSKYFQKSPDSDVYVDGANFNEVFKLYFFDKEIKHLLLNAILSAEHHLKSILAHRFAEKYPNKRYAYLCAECYKQDKTLNIIYTISKISNVINKNINGGNNSISYYVNKYNDVPIWVIVDYLNFGDLRSIISCLPETVQNKISLDLCSFIKENILDFEGLFSPENMNSFIRNIHEVRNICAHNNRLLDFKCRASSKFFMPLHSKYDISKTDNRTTVYTTFLSLQCFLTKTEYGVLNNSIRKRARNLNKHLKSIGINDILQLLGFPSDWNTLPTIPQDS